MGGGGGVPRAVWGRLGKLGLLGLEDGVATLWPAIQQATLDIVRRAYGRVLPSRVVADEIAAW